MLKGATARRYAEAAFEIAREQGSVDRWLEDLRVVAEYFGDHRLAFILSEPNITFDRKQQVVKDLLAGKVQQDALGLALLLVERGLVELAKRILVEYERLFNDYHNQVVAEVTTAMPLEADSRELIRRDLQEVTGKKILLQERVDPAILGGAIARVGDTLIDGSVKRRLAVLRQQILRGGGAFGGPGDRREATVDGSAAATGATEPFVAMPTEEDGWPNGDRPGGDDGSSASDMGPRRGPSPHLGPSIDRNGPGRGGDRRDNRRNKGNKGRRR